MAEQLNKFIDNLKEFWTNLEPKRKRFIIYVTSVILVFAVGLTVFINLPKLGYKVIFPGMTSAETTQVYASLMEMGVTPQIDDKGNVLVPKAQWDNLQYSLSAQGFPKTTLTYDTFSSMSGFTTTEFEKRVALTYELQDRLQSTFMRWNGISDAVVTINIPESNNFAWNQAQRETSTASVTITTRPGYSLTPEQVSAIKNHAASAVPRLSPADVAVVDAATGIEPPSLDDENGAYSTRRIEYERQIEKAIEDNVKRLLTPTYGLSGITAVCKVRLDYDKIVTERREVLPQEDDGNGVVTRLEEHYTVGGNPVAEGLPGEENNTDTPTYPNLSGLDGTQISDFDRVTDLDVGYILTQIEKGEPLLEQATLSVVVDDPDFNEEKQTLLIDLISKSVNIDPFNIMVANMDFQTDLTGAQVTDGGFMQYLPYVIGGVITILLLVGLVVFLIARARRARMERENALALAEGAASEEQRQRDLEKEIADHKRMLLEEAQNSENLKDNAITQEVRDFAERNPEITANLIRSLMKEER